MINEHTPSGASFPISRDSIEIRTAFKLFASFKHVHIFDMFHWKPTEQETDSRACSY